MIIAIGITWLVLLAAVVVTEWDPHPWRFRLPEARVINKKGK